jgi:outer membrane protein insertion porin family
MPLLIPLVTLCEVFQPFADVFEIRGASVVSPTILTAKLKQLRSPTRQALVSTIQDEYKSAGYPLAVVSDVEQKGSTWVITVVEGRVRNIIVNGSKKTSVGQVTRFLDTQSGRPYHMPTSQKDRARLARLGAFADVQIAPVTVEDSANAELGTVDVKVTLKDTQTGNIAATVGYGDFTGFTGFVSLTENNLFGSLNQARLNWQRWTNLSLDASGNYVQQPARQAFSLNLQRPLGNRASSGMDVSVYDQNTLFLPTFSNNVQTLRNYEQRKGGSVRLGRKLGRNDLWVGYRHDDVSMASAPTNLGASNEELAASTGTVGAVRFQLGSDTRDNSTNPQSGSNWKLSSEKAASAFGGTATFSKSELDFKTYNRIGARAKTQKQGLTLAGRTMLGLTSGVVPLTEQFYLGGFDLMRGYDLYSLRGKTMFMQTAELRVPLAENVTGAFFVDYGGASKTSMISGKDLKTGVGAGLRFATPFGPIRLDFAVGRRLQTYVSLGQSF